MPIVFVSFGTLGDAQPLYVVASRIAAQGGDNDNTPACAFVTHAELRPKLPPVKGIEFRALELPCFLGDTNDVKNPICVVRGRRQEWEQASLLSRDATLLIFNLFAMPVGVHLGEKLSVPTVCLSPSLIHYECPVGFAHELSRNFPEIPLRQEFTDWLWPIFTEAHGHFREEFLGLPRIPLLDGAAWTHFPKLIIGVDPMWLHDVEAEDVDVDVDAKAPSCAYIDTFWLPPVPARIDTGNCADVLITFGSLQPLLPHSTEWLQCFRRVAQLSQLRMWIQWPRTTERHVADVAPLERIGHVPFGTAFQKVSCVVHHGGLGTVAEALRAGTPQLILPICFDQPYWAAHIERLGYGVQLDPWAKPNVVDLMRAVKRSLTLQVAPRVFRDSDVHSLLPPPGAMSHFATTPFRQQDS